MLGVNINKVQQKVKLADQQKEYVLFHQQSQRDHRRHQAQCLNRLDAEEPFFVIGLNESPMTDRVHDQENPHSPDNESK